MISLSAKSSALKICCIRIFLGTQMAGSYFFLFKSQKDLITTKTLL